MGKIEKLIRSHFPKISEMPFLNAIQNGRFGRSEILKSEIVELYRALNTRGLIQEMYKEKLNEGLKKKVINTDQRKLMEEVIDDEGETEDHIDHLDMRFKLFEGTSVKRGTWPIFHSELESINNEWMSICRESSLFTLMCCTSAIEGWYPDISRFFEKEYRKRGFSDHELEIFIAHQGADVEHSEAQYAIIEDNADKIDIDNVNEMIERTFKTSKAYDKFKLEFAMSDKPLDSFIEKRQTT